MTDTPEVLFVCVHNAGRSQMAAALLDHHAKGRVQVRSAGSDPADRLNPAVAAAMDEWGIDLSREFPKPLTDQAVRAADVVITMGCGDACPFYPGQALRGLGAPGPRRPAGRGGGAPHPRRHRCPRPAAPSRAGPGRRLTTWPTGGPQARLATTSPLGGRAGVTSRMTPDRSRACGWCSAFGLLKRRVELTGPARSKMAPESMFSNRMRLMIAPG